MTVMVQLKQPALLPCEQNCSSSLKWAFIDKPHNIVAQCDQTSCSPAEGFFISHDRYLKGNLSLTVIAADYTMRNTYTCTCDGGDIVNSVRLGIKRKRFYLFVSDLGVNVSSLVYPIWNESSF